MTPDDPRTLLGPLDVPPPPADRVARTVAAAAPLLAARARLARRRAWVRPLAIGLLPLPAIVVLNWVVVRALHALVSLVLPEPIGTYLAAQYALLVLCLLAATYAAVPILADRQARAALENAHV